MLPQHFTDLDEHLAVGSYPSSPETIELLHSDHGIGAVVSLQSDADLKSRGLDWNQLWMVYARAKVKIDRIPVTDFDKADLTRNLSDAVDAVAKHIDAGRKVYVHCNAGLNRSPSTIIGYLIAHRGLSVDDAVAWLSDRHECMPYRDVIERWAKRRR